MANGHGGSRTPSKPAPVSGPGAMSRRTDGQGSKYVSGLPYGEGQDFMDLQSSAPMAKAATATPNMRPGSAAALGANAPTPLGAPTERPDEPLTEGNPMGPGRGPDALSVPVDAEGRMKRDMAAFKPYLPVLIAAANRGDASPTFVQFVQKLRGA